MADEKTPEEKLLDDKKALEGGSTEKKTEEVADERTPEQKIIDELKGNLEAANKRAAQAESQRDSERVQKDSARTEATTARERQVLAEEEKLKTAVAGAKSAFDAAQREWDDAYDAGDKQKLRDAQIKLNDAQMALRGSEFQEGNFKKWKETQKSAPVDDGLFEMKTGTGDVIRVPQSAIDWANKHPKLKTDSDYTDSVYDADMRAKRRGIKVYSQDYYDFIDSHLKKSGLEDDDGDDPVKKDAPVIKKSDKQSTAAPPGGSTGSTGGSSKKNSFTLTADMRKAAQIVFPDEYKKDPAAAEEKYAKYQMEMKKSKN